MKNETTFTTATGEEAERILMGCGFYNRCLEMIEDARSKDVPAKVNVLTGIFVTTAPNLECLAVEFTLSLTTQKKSFRVFHFKANDIETAGLHLVLLQGLKDKFAAASASLGAMLESGSSTW